MTKKKILLIDDELMILMSMQRMLDDVYDITIAKSGTEAINIINEQSVPFDLIIIDVNMPNMSGIDFFLKMKEKHPEFANYIIFMTGANMNTIQNEFFATHKNLRLSKPFEHEQLRQIIKEYLAAKSP